MARQLQTFQPFAPKWPDSLALSEKLVLIEEPFEQADFMRSLKRFRSQSALPTDPPQRSLALTEILEGRPLRILWH